VPGLPPETATSRRVASLRGEVGIAEVLHDPEPEAWLPVDPHSRTG
jgi:hypothetical protein